jgi:hypothetical protein
MLALALEFWGVSSGHLNVRPIVERLSKVWKKWEPTTRAVLLVTADAIAAAERARSVSPSPTQRSKTIQLSRSIVGAAKLSKELRAMFPPPWDGERAWLGHLYLHLSEYIRGAIRGVVDADRASPVFIAKAHVELLISETSAQGTRSHWELLALLVWLAGGMKGNPRSESTMRRWVREPSASWSRTPHLQSRLVRNRKCNDS